MSEAERNADLPNRGQRLIQERWADLVGAGLVLTLFTGTVAVMGIAHLGLEQQRQALATTLTQSLAESIAAGASHHDTDEDATREELNQMLRRLGARKLIDSVEWRRSDGTARFSWTYNENTNGLTDAPAPVLRRSMAEAEALGLQVAQADVEHDGESLGTVFIAAPPPRMPSVTTMLWIWGGVALAGTLAVFALLYRWFWRQLRPMVAIERGLSDYAAGLEEQLSALQLSDTLGQTAHAWNRLLRQADDLRNRLDPQTSGNGISQVSERFESRALRQMLDRLPFGVLHVRGDQRVGYANLSAGELLGISADSLIGESAEAAIQEESITRAIGTAQARGGSGLAIDRRRVQGDHETTLRFVVSPAGEGFAEREALVAIQDVSHLREAERARDNFLYHVTHELRTPLTNIRAYAETLTRQEFDDEQTRKECYNVIISETGRLSRLVNDILSISQLEVGTALMEMGDVDLTKLIRQTVQDNMGGADDKRIELSLTLPPKTPKVRADKQRLAVLLNNLIGNAIKYTPEEGEVDVTVDTRDEMIQIEVRDTGIGIDASEQGRVFDKFYRSQQGDIQTIPGTGLGLAIAREIARLHGGDIRLQSEPGKGSTFTIELPYHESAN